MRCDSDQKFQNKIWTIEGKRFVNFVKPVISL